MISPDLRKIWLTQLKLSLGLIWIIHAYTKKPYPPEFDFVSYPTGLRVSEFTKFNGDGTHTTWKHMRKYILQLGEANFHDALRVCLCSLSLTGTAFSWFFSLAANSIQTWNQLERRFQNIFFSAENEAKLMDLISVRQGRDDSTSNYFRRFKDIKKSLL
jgi:hypothetical protein